MKELLEEILTRALGGALAGAAASSGVVPGAGHRVLADSLKRIMQNQSTVEFLARAMQHKELPGVPWDANAKDVQNRWRARARDAIEALQQLCERLAEEAKRQATDPERLIDTAADALKGVARKTMPPRSTGRGPSTRRR